MHMATLLCLHVLLLLMHADGTFDYKSLHGSCPVIAGEKWSATKWWVNMYFEVLDSLTDGTCQ